MIKGIYVDYFVNIPSSRLTSSIIFVVILIIAVLLIVYFTTFVQQAEYKIPIQYTKVAQGAPSSSYLPLKVNPAGGLSQLSLQVPSQQHLQPFFNF